MGPIRTALNRVAETQYAVSNIMFGVNADYIVIRLWRVIFQTNLFLFPSASSIKTQSGGFMFELVPNPCHVTCRDHHVFYMYPCPGDTLGSAI